MFLVALFILFVAIFFLVLSAKKGNSKSIQKNDAVDSELSIPGSAEVIMDAKNVEELLVGYETMCNTYFEHGISYCWIGPLKVVSVWDPQLIEAVGNCPLTQSKGEFYKIVFSSLANGVFTHPGGQEWRELRKPIVQSMSKRYLENDFFTQFVYKSNDFIDFLKRNRQGKYYDIGKDVCSSVFDIFTATHVGVTTNDLNDRIWTVSDLAELEFEISLDQVMMFHYYSIQFVLGVKRFLITVKNYLASLKFVSIWIGDGKSSQDEGDKSQLVIGDWNSISTFFEEVLSFLRLKGMKLMNFSINKFYLGLTEGGRKLRNSERKAKRLLKELMECRLSSEKKLDDIEGLEYYPDFLMRRKELRNLNFSHILDELADVVAAGSDTTPVVVSSVLVFIAMHPEVQDNLFKEQKEIYGDSDREPTIEDLPKMKYLERVIKETLRFVTAPVVAKTSDEACLIGKYRVPKTCIIFCQIRSVHRNPMYYEKPDEFYPDHFLPEAEAKRPRCAYLPFGVGPRKCPGFQYANILMKVMLSMIIRNFTMKTPITMETIQFNYRLLLNIRGGYLIELHSR